MCDCNQSASTTSSIAAQSTTKNIQATPIDAAAADQLSAFQANLLNQAELQRQLAGVRYRLLSTLPIESGDKDSASAQPARWSALIYDYTNNRVVEASADFPSAANAAISTNSSQPLPSAEEWEEAAEIVRRDVDFSRFLLCDLLVPYRPMPALLQTPGPTGAIERTLLVGLLPAANSALSHQIVAVNMVTQRTATLPNGRPDISLADPTTCGIAPFYCPSPARGTPGQMWISWPQPNPVWRLQAVRPAASSGVSGSGLEVRFVDYKGKRVLYRGHVPILNVKYDGDACGPYRDWQHDEHCFQCDGADLGSGFRLANTPPKTACNGSDSGNFTGVAVYETDCELVLTTEMEAGWYRYIQEWRFHRDGTIRPRFKFTAVSNSCVCNVHVHHCYWRLDFDILTPGNNLVQEYNNPPIIPNTNWHKKEFEIKRFRDYGRHRKWRVSNTQSGDAYDVNPGPTDGVADPAYGKGDVWILRYHGNELDDGGFGIGTAADLDKFVNGEVVDNQDVVIWYGAHFRHDVREQGPGECHEVGPTLTPVQW
jgi:Cu2+-containing amine oxidase